MRPPKVLDEVVCDYFQARQRAVGWVTGQDITRFARFHHLHPVAFRRRFLHLMGNHPGFSGIKYRSQRDTSVMIEECIAVSEALQEAPLIPPATIVRRLNEARKAQGRPPIPESSIRVVITSYSLGLPTDRMDPLSWLTYADIPVGPPYHPAHARGSLDTDFAWSGITTPYGVSLSKGLEKLQTAEDFFQASHPGVQPHLWYEELWPRAPCLSAFLGSVTLDRAPAVVARLAFESQALFLTQLRDLLPAQLRRKWTNIQQTLRARHLGKAWELACERDDLGRGLAEIQVASPSSDSGATLLQWAHEPRTLKDRARALLRLDPRVRERYVKLGNAFVLLTRGFDPTEVIAHTPRTRLLLDLARGTTTWDQVAEEERTCLGKNRRLLAFVPDSQQEAFRDTLLIDRIVDAVKRGNVTLSKSWAHQDVGARAASVVLPEDPKAWPLPPATLASLFEGTYVVDLAPLKELRRAPPETRDEGEGDEDEWVPRPGYMEMAQEVHDLILEYYPDWYLLHRRTLEDYWDGTFRMEYKEETFTHRLLLAIGLLGRDYRLRDDPAYVSLKHFLRRCVTPPTLELELRLYHDVVAFLVGRRAQGLLVDTLGREGPSTHPQMDWHGRYLLQGFSDFRGIGELRLPIYSMAISPKETEAMRCVELVARARRVAGDQLRIYGGNGHTVSRLSASLLFGTFGMASAGHVVHDPPALPSWKQERLGDHLPELNRVFLLLRQRPELGRILAARSHVYVGRTNVRPILADLGGEVIRAVQATGYDWREAQSHIESSNALKRAVSAAVGGAARMEPRRLDLSLLSGEAILMMTALRRYKQGAGGDGVSLGAALSDIDLYRPT